MANNRVRAIGGPNDRTVTCWLKDRFDTLVPNPLRRGAFLDTAGPAAHNFTIDATSVTHTVTTRNMGCHLDSGFGEELLALHSNIVFSPSFEYGDPTQESPNVTGHPVGVGWVPVREAAEGTYSGEYGCNIGTESHSLLLIWV